MNLSFEVEVLANIKGGLSIIYFCILIELPRKSAAFLPLLNLLLMNLSPTLPHDDDDEEELVRIDGFGMNRDGDGRPSLYHHCCR